MKTPILTFFLVLSQILLFSGYTSSQESKASEKKEFWHRISVGGNLGFQVGSITGIVLSPEVKIRVVDQLHLGVGFNYIYVKFKDYYRDLKTNEYIDFTSNVYGGRLFARYYLSSIFDNALGNVFGHLEYEYLTYTSPFEPSNPPDGTILGLDQRLYKRGKQVIGIESVFIGAGYSQPLGGRAFLDLILLFNLNDSYNSPYTNPVFRIGFGLGL
jgi:hypothetical protein